MFRSLLAAAEAKWTAAGQWNQTDQAGVNENPETNVVFALRSALPILAKSAEQDPVNRQRPIPRHLPSGPKRESHQDALKAQNGTISESVPSHLPITRSVTVFERLFNSPYTRKG
jgi:hypothetical protein